MTWEDVWAEIEDIGQSITMTNDQASDITGHFCDLFHGMHTTYGKVALKRPRVKHQNYNKGDVRVSSLRHAGRPLVESSLLADSDECSGF